MELLVLEKTDVKEMWKTDLIDFLAVLDKVENEEEEDRKKNEDMMKKDGKGQRAKRKV